MSSMTTQSHQPNESNEHRNESNHLSHQYQSTPDESNGCLQSLRREEHHRTHLTPTDPLNPNRLQKVQKSLGLRVELLGSHRKSPNEGGPRLPVKSPHPQSHHGNCSRFSEIFCDTGGHGIMRDLFICSPRTFVKTSEENKCGRPAEYRNFHRVLTASLLAG